MTYERIVRRLRQHAFDERTPQKEAQFERVLARAIEKKVAQYPPQPTGPYSGLTRRELAATGTCETDWF